MHHFVQKDPEAPHVKAEAIKTPTYHFRSHVVPCPTKCISQIVAFDGSSKVAYFDIVFAIQEQILRLDVSVYYLLRVEVAYSLAGLGEEMSCLRFRKHFIFSQKLEKVSSGGIFEQEIHVVLVFEDRLQLNDVVVAECE